MFPNEVISMAIWMLDNIVTPQTIIPAPKRPNYHWSIAEDLIMMVRSQGILNYPKLSRSKDSKKCRRSVLRAANLGVVHMQRMIDELRIGSDLFKLRYDFTRGQILEIIDHTINQSNDFPTNQTKAAGQEI